MARLDKAVVIAYAMLWFPAFADDVSRAENFLATKVHINISLDRSITPIEINKQITRDLPDVNTQYY